MGRADAVTLPFGTQDFDSIVAVHGENVVVQHRASSTRDALNEQVMAASGSPVTIVGVVQDVSTNDLKRVAGVWQYGDKTLFTKAADVALVPSDRLTIQGKAWMVVMETTEETGGVTIFREYLIRRASSG